jgi:hypothetical protein
MYWKFRVILVGKMMTTPSVSSVVIYYTDPTPIEFWSNEIPTVEAIYEVLFSHVTSPFPVGSEIEVGIYQEGTLEWASVDKITSIVSKSSYQSPQLLWRGQVGTKDSLLESFRLVLRIKNKSPDSTMKLHDWGIIYNTRGAW